MTAEATTASPARERRNPLRSSLTVEPLSRRWMLGGIAILVYSAAFFPLYSQAGVGITALSLFPVVILGWLFGAWGGLLGGAGVVPINALLLTVVGQPGLLLVLDAGAVEASALGVVVGCVIGLLRDLAVRLDHHLTEWRRAARALRETEDRYRMLFERSRDPLYVTKPDGQILDVNDAMVSLLGYSKIELLDMDVTALYEDPIDRERLTSNISVAGFVESFPVRLVTRSGGIRECLLTSSARSERGVVQEYQGVIHDASDDPALHELAERRTRELKEAVAELEAFSYSVSHDLRTHLVTMGGFASVLWADHRESLDDQGQEFLRRIVRAGQRMDGFVGDLLNLSKVSRRRVQTDVIALDHAVQETLEVLRPQIEARGAAVDVEDGLPPVTADPMLLSRLLENLVSNAVKFVAEERQPKVRIRARHENTRVRIEVEDNGIGIETRKIADAFRAFERLDPSRFPGTGVGLAIVQKCAERMGGEVGVESKLGEGSTFWVHLPSATQGDPDKPSVD